MFVTNTPTSDHQKNTTTTEKHGAGSVMLWGCLSSAGTGAVVEVEEIMNGFKHQTLFVQHVQV